MSAQLDRILNTLIKKFQREEILRLEDEALQELEFPINNREEAAFRTGFVKGINTVLHVIKGVIE